jgi:hypothetical protein
MHGAIDRKTALISTIVVKSAHFSNQMAIYPIELSRRNNNHFTVFWWGRAGFDQ